MDSNNLLPMWWWLGAVLVLGLGPCPLTGTRYPSQGNMIRIPVGGIFDTVSREARSAFSYEIMNVNSDNATRVKLDANSQKIQVNDSFNVATTMCSQMSSGIFALFGTHDMRTINTVRSFTNTFHMPYVTPSMPVNASGQNNGFMLYMRPYYIQAIVDIIKHYRWTKIFYLFDSEDGLIRLQQLFDAIVTSDLDIEVKVYEVATSVTAVYEHLMAMDQIHRDENKPVLLDIPNHISEEVLKRQDRDTWRVNFHYVLVGLGAQELNLTVYDNGGINMTGFQLVDFKNQTLKRFFDGWGRLDSGRWRGAGGQRISYEAALAVDSVRLLSRALQRLTNQQRRIFRNTIRNGKFWNNGSEGIDCDAEPVVPWMYGMDIMKALRNTELYGLSGHIKFDDYGLRVGYSLNVLEVSFARRMATIGKWTPEQGLSGQTPEHVRPKGTNNVSSEVRIVTSILTEPFLMQKPENMSNEDGTPNIGNDRFEGYCADLAKKVAEIVQIDYHIQPVKDGKYGSKDENNTWNGMVGELVRKTPPFLEEVQENKHGAPLVGNDRFHGYCKDLTDKVCPMVGVDYLIAVVKDKQYGNELENGTWDGMVGELIRGEADLAIAPLTIISVRERVIDFSKPFMSLGISIMIKKPTKEMPGVFSFMYPLSYEIWMCVIFAYIGVSVVLFLVSRFSPFEWHIEDNSDGPTVTNNFTIFNSLWFSLGAFMQQGCDIEPRSLSGRIVGSVWWFFTLIIISSYTANLAAFLTVERMQSPIESADDLAKQTEIKYGTVEGGSTMGFFKTSSIPVYERMWAFMSSAEPSVFLGSNEKGVQRVRDSNGRYAFLVESTTNDYINELKPCDTMKVGSNLDSKGYGIGTPLGSELRDRITLAVLELRENGELQKLEKKWWYEKGECGKGEKTTKKKDATSALKLMNVAGIFYILMGGLVLALIIAALEFLYKTRKDARRRKTSFCHAFRSRARLSLKGTPERSPPPAQGGPDLPPNMSMSTYTYAPAAQLISLDGYADGNTHTQV